MRVLSEKVLFLDLTSERVEQLRSLNYDFGNV